MREVLITRRHSFCGVVLVKPTTLQLQLEMLKQYCPPIHIGLLYIFILQCKVSDFLFWLIAWHKKHTRSKIILSVMNGQYFRLCSKNRTGVFKAWDCGPPRRPSLGKGAPPPFKFLDAHGINIMLFDPTHAQQLSQDSLIMLFDITSDYAKYQNLLVSASVEVWRTVKFLQTTASLTKSHTFRLFQVISFWELME